MDVNHLMRLMEEGLQEIPVIDVHTHLVGGKLGAGGLHDLLLYHMVISDLYAAGCPSGQRLTEYPGWPSSGEASQRIEEAIPFLPHIRNTSSSWILRQILRDLYDWSEPITASNWRQLDGMIRERADDQEWHHSVFDRMRVSRTGTEIARRGNGSDDPRLQYALEWGFFTRCQWGEFDTALYELEKCWGRTPSSPSPIGKGKRPVPEKTIRSLEDVHAAVEHYVSAIPYDQVLSMATHLSTDIHYRVISKDEMSEALKLRSTAGAKERDIYASYVHELFLEKLAAVGKPLVFQFSFAAEPLPFETGSRVSQQTISELGEMMGRHSSIRFQCFLASAHANQSLCTLARELPNFSLAGFWWHNFFPSLIERVMAERWDMLPLNKQIGFFSDAYCVEWSYGKLKMVRQIMAKFLAGRVAAGQCSVDEALSLAQEVLYESPQTLLGFTPRKVT